MDLMSELLARRRSTRGSPGAASADWGARSSTRGAPCAGESDGARSRAGGSGRVSQLAGRRRPEVGGGGGDARPPAVGRAGPGPRRGRPPRRRAGHLLPNAACSRPCPRSRRSPRRASPPRWWTRTAPRPPVCARSVSCTPTSWRRSVRASTRGSSTSSTARAASSVPPAWPDARPRSSPPDRCRGRVPGSCARLLDVSASAPEAARIPPSTLVVQLLGRPRIDVDGAPGYRYRSRKSWALLAFLLLGERPPTRSQLASLLFAEADDPLGALRWCLAEIRRALGPAVVLDGDPVIDLAARRHHGGRGRAGPRSLEHRRRAPGPGPRPARRPRHPARRRLRVVAALRAPSARGRHGVDPARGGARAPRPWGPRPSARPGRPGRRDESSGREPPGAADQALPSRRRGRGRPAPVRRLGVGRRAGARRTARCSRPARDAGGTAGRRARTRPSRSRR